MSGGPAAADAVLAAGAAAVVCHNDMLAIGLMRRLAQRGVMVPRDISVVGFDNIVGADFCTPPLTTLSERSEEAGTRAVEALALQVNSRAPHTSTQLLPTQLVIRESTGAPRGAVSGTSQAPA
jgi:LacI family transcriptional regulator